MKQLISITLSLLMLLSSSGITYAQHFCGDFEMLAKVTLGLEHLSCGMTISESTCDSETQEDHDCCDNEYSQINTDENYTASDFNFQVSPIFAATFVSVFILQTETFINDQNTLFARYQPPPLIKDIPVLFETFLI
ncbi:HYC_CC_PP family protein [Patiriisocius marinus]|uniref:HYC_CC_PP family protein n=1 Tax=Patiriisocius marinus TaxID=1397112 RepID=UPI00232B5BDC|nr:hypothetical protein [Patiriisocius marinus]